MRKLKGFTLIELLIVVAIIAILAAIAVPNFLEAQVRSKVSRVKSDQRTTATAIEAYFVDWQQGPTDSGNGSYPVKRPYGNGAAVFPPVAGQTIGYELTTPIAYLTSSTVFRDPFKMERADLRNNPATEGRDHYLFVNWVMRNRLQPSLIADQSIYGIVTERTGLWWLSSAGPDRFSNNTAIGGPDFGSLSTPYRVSYDPTNGTVSLGDIFRTQKYGVGILEQAPTP